MASPLDNSESAPLLSVSPDAGSLSLEDQEHSTRPSSLDLEGSSDAGSVNPSRSVEDDVVPETSTLGRTLSWGSAYIIVISRVIGSGIFATPGTIVQAVGSPGLALLLWVVGAVIAACGVAVSLEYGCMLPRSGGQKVYLEFTYRHPRFLASTLIAIYSVLLGFTASNCVIFSEYVLFAIDKELASNDAARKVLAAGVLTFITAVHIITPKAGVKIQDFLGWFKIVLVVLMILSGLWVVVFRLPSHKSWDGVWDHSKYNWHLISTALFKVFYSYAGLDNVSNVLNEVKDPVRTLRSVTLAALATACAIYFLINVTYFLVIPIDEIKGSEELIAALFFEKLFGSNVGGKVLPLAVALSAFSNVFVVAFAMVRIYCAFVTLAPK